MKRKTILNDIFAALALLLYFAELVFPKITTLFSSSLVCLICFCFWIFSVLTIDYKFLLKKNNFILLLIYLYLSTYPLLFGNNTISNRYISMSIILCGSIIFQYYYVHNRLNILKKILTITLFLAFITMQITYSQLLLNPNISRSIKSSGEYSLSLAQKGIGGYSFVYFITALSVPLLYYAIKVKNQLKRIIATIIYVFSVVFIIKSNYMTAFLTVIVCSTILIMLLIMSNKNIGFGLSIFIIGLLLILSFNVDNILTFIGDFLPDRISRVLISKNSETLTGSIMQEFLLDRFPTILTSLEALINHPIAGAVGSKSLEYSGNFLIGFGQHSFIFDTFALFGLFGGMIGGYAVLSPMENNKIWSNHFAFRIAMITCVLMLYFFNNATESIALVVTIIAPFFAVELNNYV